MPHPFSFELAIVTGAESDALRIVLNMTNVPLGDIPAYVEDMARTIPLETLVPALFVLAGSATAQAGSIDPAAGTYSIALPAKSVSEPWRVACMLNLVEFAVAEDDLDLRLIKRVEAWVRKDFVPDPQICFADLLRRKAKARAQLARYLPANFSPDEYVAGEWPEEAEYYDFNLSFTFEKAFSAEAADRLAALGDALDRMIGWMGFEHAGSATEWQEQSKMLYEFEMSIDGSTVRLDFGGPPADIALAIEILLQEASASSGLIVSHDVSIEPI